MDFMTFVKQSVLWVKRRPVRGVLLALLLVFSTLFFIGQAMDSLKVIDPSDPRFDPMKFRFEDYAGLHTDPEPKLLTPALLKMFPPGTEEAYIDKILVEQAGAGKYKYRGNDKGYRYSRYAMGGLTGWVVIVIYDDGKSVSLRRGPSRNLYEQKR